MGLPGRAVVGGVRFDGGVRELCAANIGLRTASRVLVRVAQFEASAFHELERRARAVDWSRFLAPGAAVDLRVTCRRSKLYHQGAVAQRIRDAIDRQIGLTEAPDAAPFAQLFVVRFDRDRCTISVDSSGELLHRRAYREALAKAPLRETLAAAMLLACGWSPVDPLLDPMCGSGTIPIEAALIARRIAPGLIRSSQRAGSNEREPAFALERWPVHDALAFHSELERAQARVLPSAPAPIRGSDRDAGAILAAHENAARAGVAQDIDFQVDAISNAVPPGPRPWVVCNPPYGRRIGGGSLRDLYSALGNRVRNSMPGASIALLSAHRRLDAQTGFALDEILRTRNGGIPVRLLVARP